MLDGQALATLSTTTSESPELLDWKRGPRIRGLPDTATAFLTVDKVVGLHEHVSRRSSVSRSRCVKEIAL